MITGVAKVVVPVADQERAKHFWTGAIGFDVVIDESYGDERWIEVEAPDRSVVLVLSRRPSNGMSSCAANKSADRSGMEKHGSRSRP
jgi:hypothetical protein